MGSTDSRLVAENVLKKLRPQLKRLLQEKNHKEIESILNKHFVNLFIKYEQNKILCSKHYKLCEFARIDDMCYRFTGSIWYPEFAEDLLLLLMENNSKYFHDLANVDMCYHGYCDKHIAIHVRICFYLYKTFPNLVPSYLFHYIYKTRQDYKKYAEYLNFNVHLYTILKHLNKCMSNKDISLLARDLIRHNLISEKEIIMANIKLKNENIVERIIYPRPQYNNNNNNINNLPNEDPPKYEDVVNIADIVK